MILLDSTEDIITLLCQNSTEFSHEEMSLVTLHLHFRGLISGDLLYASKQTDFKY